MELSKQQNAGSARVHSILDRFGCLPSITPMTELREFKPIELAQAIEKNLEECGIYGHTKITIHLDLVDAKMLATHLRRK